MIQLTKVINHTSSAPVTEPVLVNPAHIIRIEPAREYTIVRDTAGEMHVTESLEEIGRLLGVKPSVMETKVIENDPDYDMAKPTAEVSQVVTPNRRKLEHK